MIAPTLARAASLNFVDGGVTLSAALIVSVLLARTLGPDRFGLYALVMSVIMVILLLARLGISNTVRRFVAEQHGRGDPSKARLIVGRGLRLGLLSGLGGSVLLGATAWPLATFFHRAELRTYLMLGAAMILPMVVLGILRSVAGGYQQYRYLLTLNLITSPLWVIGCVIAVGSGAGVAGVLIATLAIDVAQVVVVGWWVAQRVGLSLSSSLPDLLGTRLVRYNLTLAALIILNAIVWERSELLFLGRFSSASQVAFYAVPFALTEKLVDLIPGALLGVLLPRLTFAQSIDPTRFGAAFSDALRHLAMLTLPICLFGIPLAPAVIQLLYGSGYVGAVVVLQILLVSIIFGVLGQAARSALLGIESQGFLLKTGLVAALISITLDFALIPRYGAIGAAIANTFVQGLWAVTILMPLWHRIVGGTGTAIVKAASLALTLTALLFLLSRLSPTASVSLGAGLAVLVIYAIGLGRMNLLNIKAALRFS